MRLASPSVGGTWTGTMTKGLIWLCDTQLTPLSRLLLLLFLLLPILSVLSAALKGILKDQKETTPLFCSHFPITGLNFREATSFTHTNESHFLLFVHRCMRPPAALRLSRVWAVNLHHPWMWELVSSWVWLLVMSGRVTELYAVLQSVVGSLSWRRNVREGQRQVCLRNVLFHPWNYHLLLSAAICFSAVEARQNKTFLSNKVTSLSFRGFSEER